MHIYRWQIDPTPSQLSIDALNTATPNLADILADVLPSSIEHRCIEYHYIKLGRCTTTTPNKFHIYIAQCTYTYGRLTPPPPPSKHRSLENHYTKYISYICDNSMGVHRYTRWTGRLSHQTSDLSRPHNLLLEGCDLCFN